MGKTVSIHFNGGVAPRGCLIIDDFNFPTNRIFYRVSKFAIGVKADVRETVLIREIDV